MNLKRLKQVTVSPLVVDVNGKATDKAGLPKSSSAMLLTAPAGKLLPRSSSTTLLQQLSGKKKLISERQVETKRRARQIQPRVNVLASGVMSHRSVGSAHSASRTRNTTANAGSHRTISSAKPHPMAASGNFSSPHRPISSIGSSKAKEGILPSSNQSRTTKDQQ